MILHMLCLLMVMMMFSSVISAPGQIHTREDSPLARKDEPRPKSSGTLDSIGGGHLLRAESPDFAENNFRSLELFVSYQNDIPQDMVLVTREDKQKPSSSGTLDPLGGGNLVRVIDPEADTEVFRALESLLDSQNVLLESVVQIPLEDQPQSLSPNLDPLGGGNFVRNADPDAATEITKSLETHLEKQDDTPQSVIQIARDDKPKLLSPNLDPIGGGNLVKNADSDTRTEITKSLDSHLENKDDILQSVVSLARGDKQKSSSSGTLDPLGGGNIVRIVEPDVEAEFDKSLFNSKENLFQKLISVVHEDKRTSSGPLDPLGGGNFVGKSYPNSEAEFVSTFESLVESQDNVLQKLISLISEDMRTGSSSGTLDPIGGDSLIGKSNPKAETEVFSSLESLIDNQDNLARENQQTQKPQNPDSSPSRTLDPIGGDNIVRADSSRDILRSMEVAVDSQGRQNMMRLAREDKSMQRSSHALDGHVADPYRGQMFRSLDHSHLVDTVDQGGDVQRMLDSLTASDLLSLDSSERMAVLNALRSTHSKYPKRMLDSVSGWAFGESKRNFDEIDNVGFTGFAKRGYPKYKSLALAKKNFDEIDRAGFETYNKRDFDEIDRAGFDTFEKRDRKE